MIRLFVVLIVGALLGIIGNLIFGPVGLIITIPLGFIWGFFAISIFDRLNIL
jgi:hypothetical protein